jgi:hypothetical protein
VSFAARASVSALCLALFAGSGSPALTGAVTVFGPQDAVRTRGKSWVWNRFSVPDPSAPHTLRILNGGASGEMHLRWCR